MAKLKFNIYLFLILIICSSNVFAVSNNVFDFNRYQYNRQNTGTPFDLTSAWDSASSSNTTSISGSIGATYPPLIVDLDNDDIAEYITHEGNYIYIQHFSGGSLLTVGQKYVGLQQGTDTVIYDYNNDGLNELITVNNNTIYILQFNALNTNTITQLSATKLTTSIYSGIYCDSEQLINEDIKCWYADNNQSIIEWDLTNYVLNVKETTLNNNETDGIFESDIIVAGQDSNNNIYESSFLFTNINESQSVTGLTFKLKSIIGNPQNAGLVYDFSVCPTTKTQLTNTGELNDDCSGSITTLQSQFSLSDIIAQYSAGDIIYLPFNQEYALNKNYNYIFMLTYDYSNYTNSNDYITASADLHINSNLYRQRNIPSTNSTTATNDTIYLYDWLKSSQTDNVTDWNLYFLGIDDGRYIENKQLIKFNTAGIIQSLSVNVSSITGNPENQNLTYNLYICPTTTSNFGTNDLFADCSQTPTLLINRTDISAEFGNTIGIKTLMFDTQVLVNTNIYYTFIFEFINGTISSNDNRYSVRSDTSPINNLYARFYNGSYSNRYTDIISSYIIGINTTIGDFVFTALPQVNLTTQENNKLTAYNTGFDFEHNLKLSPAMSNIDYNTYKLFIPARDSSSYEGVLAWDIGSHTNYNIFGTNGFARVTTTASRDIINGIMVADKGNGGFKEIFVSSFRDEALFNKAYFTILQADGTIDDTQNILDTGSSTDPYIYVSAPAITQLNGTEYFCVAASYSYSGNENSAYYCVQYFDNDKPHELTHESLSHTYFDAKYGNILSYNINGLHDNYNELITPKGIFEYSNSEYIKKYSFLESGYVVFGDINLDGNVEICSASSTDTQCFTQFLENNVPELINKQYGGIATSETIGEPICLNSVITFSAYECMVSQTNCNYNNDLQSDNERLLINCGHTELDDTDELLTGEWSSSSPTIQCIYNQTGTYAIRFYLQDNKNPLDYSVYNTDPIIINVINGSIGETCSFGNIETASDRRNTIDGTTPAINELTELDTAVSSITGNSWVMRLLIAVIIIILFTVYGAKNHNGQPTSSIKIIIFSVVGFMITVVLGLIPIWFLLLAIILMLLILILINMMSKGNAGGV